MKKSNKKKKQITSVKGHLSLNKPINNNSLAKSESKNVIDVNKKTPRWFYVILILVPFFIFILLEFSLRLFNYGYNTNAFIDAGNGKYIFNPAIPKNYFNNVNFLPKTSEDIFDQQKSTNSYRVFILGGSSAAGYPYMPVGSFSRYIKRRLELVYPNTKVEVINLSMTAVNTYTLLDLLPDVLDQKPDLILIYAGHNEFYGALGVGSLESLGSSPAIINFILYLNKFKTTQLLRNFINNTFSLFSPVNKNEHSGTLMSRMAKDKLIKLNSEKFNDGVEQYENNLRMILSKAKKQNVPIIVGRLVSNFKDQKPFISVKSNDIKTANEIYLLAQAEFKNTNVQKSDSLFRLAKDLDALRFRAPEKFNFVIKSLSKEFEIPTVSLDSIFNVSSPGGVVGDNLMVDHLHPNIAGYKLMGKAFYEVMKNSGNLPQNENPKIPFDEQDSLTISNFMFTNLDLAIGDKIVALLKNDWPFKSKNEYRSNEDLLQPKNFIDSIAIEYIENKISWADAHLKTGSKYLVNDDVKNYIKYMNVLIYEYPVLKDIHTAVKFYYSQNKINPTDYTTKRLGLIALYTNEYDNAIMYLNQSFQANTHDAEILYNLALAYSYKKNFILATNSINECLKLDPQYTDALDLKRQISFEANMPLKK